MKWEFVTQLSFTCKVSDIPTVIAQIREEFGHEITKIAYGIEELAPCASTYEHITSINRYSTVILIDYYLNEPQTIIINQ